MVALYIIVVPVANDAACASIGSGDSMSFGDYVLRFVLVCWF